MASKRKESENDFVINSRRAIEVANSHPEISSLLDLYTMNAEERARGHAIAIMAIEALRKQNDERAEANGAYDEYEESFDELEEIYHVHKKKAQVAFKRDSEMQQRLLIDRAYPKTINNQFTTISTFYTVLTENEAFQAPLARVRLLPADIQDSFRKVGEVDEQRKTYWNEKSDVQRATIRKNEILAELDDWMDDFMDIVDLALMDDPQLKEAMGIVTPS